SRQSRPPPTDTHFPYTTLFRSYSYNMNRVQKLADNGNPQNRIGGIVVADGTQFGGIAEGERLGGLYGYKVSHILETQAEANAAIDRKSTRLNSSHVKISYAVFC